MSDLRDKVIEECADLCENHYWKGTVECGIAFDVARMVRELKSAKDVDLKDQLSEIIGHLQVIVSRMKNEYKPEEEWPLDYGVRNGTS